MSIIFDDVDDAGSPDLREPCDIVVGRLDKRWVSQTLPEIKFSGT